MVSATLTVVFEAGEERMSFALFPAPDDAREFDREAFDVVLSAPVDAHARRDKAIHRAHLR
jgi:hypothetical protein